MVSLFPDVETDLGLSTTLSVIQIDGSSKDWADLDSFNSPTQPVAAEAPKASGAVGLTASLVAAMTVVSSLY
jgi:hypothetical protein